MKKIYFSLCAFLFGLVASAAGVDITFEGSSLPAGWAVTNNNSGTVAVQNGHLDVTMTLQTNGKYRADLRFARTNDAQIILTPATDKIIAVKFIGERPDGNFKFELINNADATNKRTWNNPNGSYMTPAGNQIYYFDLTILSGYTDAAEFDAKNLNFTIADNPTSTEYSIDWIKTFASVADMEAAAAVKDDGDNDQDEANVLPSPVNNETTGVGYQTLTDAFNAAVSGDVIVVNEDQTVSTRLTVGANTTLTIKGANPDVTIRPANAGTILFLANTSTSVLNLENLTFDGNSVSRTIQFIEASSNANVNLTNVRFNNIESSNYIFVAKGGAKSTMENVWFNDCTLANKYAIFQGNDKSITFKGVIVASLYVEKDLLVTAEDLQEGTHIVLGFDPTNANRLTSKAAIVRGCGNPDYIVSGVQGYALITEPSNKSNLKIVEDVDTAISDIEFNESEAPIEYFNLQGIRVENPSNGLYIRRQGNKITKVLVK